jgi:hypothetical protein
MTAYQDALTALAELAGKASAASAGPWRVETDGAPPRYAGAEVQDGWVTVSLTRGVRGIEVAALYWDGTGNTDVDEAVANAEFLAAARTAMPALIRAAHRVLTRHAPDLPPGRLCLGCRQIWPCDLAQPILALVKELNRASAQ